MNGKYVLLFLLIWGNGRKLDFDIIMSLYVCDKITVGAIHAKSTKSHDMTTSDFHKILWGGNWQWKKIPPNFSKFLVNHGPKAGSSNFDLSATTFKGQTVVSQLLWDLQSSSLHQIKGIWKIFMGNHIRMFENNKDNR